MKFVSILALLNILVYAQNPVTIAGTDYRLSPARDVAPGQLLLLSLYGVKTKIESPTIVLPTSEGWPTTVAGISVELVQGSPATVTPTQIRAIQQGFCAVAEACSSVTQITLLIPFNLQRSAPFPFLRIKENGAVTGAVMLRPVPDNLHVLNTCDGTLISVGGASSAPPDVCTPAVMVNQKLNSLYNLIRSGDQVALWTYGAGMVNSESMKFPNAAELFAPISGVKLNFDFRPNAPASPPVEGFGITREPLFFGYMNGGNYQINFAIPAVPPGLPACDGVKVKSNLTVTLQGSNSSDAAQLCVAP